MAKVNATVTNAVVGRKRHGETIQVDEKKAERLERKGYVRINRDEGTKTKSTSKGKAESKKSGNAKKSNSSAQSQPKSKQSTESKPKTKDSAATASEQ